MRIHISPRTPLLLAITLTGLLTWVGNTPALAACTPGAADKPDLGFVDSNCDGIDGDKGAALFVAPSGSGGSDANSGSYGNPKETVAAAVTAALAAGKDVYVAAGTYDGKVAFLGATGNIGIYGGYDPQTWQRSAAIVSTLQAPGQVVGVSVPGIVLQLLTVHGVSGPTYQTSHGVRAFGAGSVALSRVTVQAAPGLSGADGATAPPQPAAAPVGDPGIASNGGCPDHGAQGGRADDVRWGGDGGAAWDLDFMFTGHNGMDDGNANPTVTGGIGGQSPGQSGGQGSSGTTGNAGQGGSADLNRVALFYQAMPGSDGTAGTRGAGGGGGAGSSEPCVVGAGGGAGGRPGIGGKGGEGGGGSIGVFAGAGARVLVLDGSVIHTSNGGKGGLGIAGQPGGAGGNGGPAGVRTYNGLTFKSGAGGNGGYGGYGGQGGGGAGGASIGVLAIDSLAVVAPDTTITVGSGGAGGIAGYDGKPGVALKTAQVTTKGGSLPAMGDFDGDGFDDATDACPIAAGTGNGCPAAEAPAGPAAGGQTGGVPTGGAGVVPAGPTAPATGTVSVSVLPASSCVSRRVFSIRINARRAHLKSGRLTVDGHRVRLVKGPRIWTARVDLRHSTRTRHTLTIRGRLLSGRAFRQTRRYRTCPR